MINAWWLLLLLPLSAVIGFVTLSLLLTSSKEDLRADILLLEEKIRNLVGECQNLQSEIRNKDMVIEKLQEHKRLEPMAKRINNEKFQEVFKDMEVELNSSYMRIKNLASLIMNCPQSEFSENLEKNIWGKIEKEN